MISQPERTISSDRQARDGEGCAREGFVFHKATKGSKEVGNEALQTSTLCFLNTKSDIFWRARKKGKKNVYVDGK